jgi:hypothetical protein
VPYFKPGMKFDYTHVFPRPFTLYRGKSRYWQVARYSFLLKNLGLGLLFHEDSFIQQDFSGHLSKLSEEKLKWVDFFANKDKLYVYAENIRSMILLCKGRNIRVFVLDLPTSPDPSHYVGIFGENFKKLIWLFERELKRVTSEENVSFIKTGPLDKTDFWDHAHNTESGNRNISKKICDVLLKKINFK